MHRRSLLVLTTSNLPFSTPFTRKLPTTTTNLPRQQPLLAAPQRIMSSITLSDLQYISREDLAARIQASHTTTSSTGLPSNIAVVDVRDSDHIGGHIRGSTWVPSSTLDYKTPELIRTLEDRDIVVFHCALSQQRGPSAALRYLREKERLDGGLVESRDKVLEGGEGVQKGEKSGKDGEGSTGLGGKNQRVVVLSGGFTEWQDKYGADEKLTEGWRRDVWEWGQ